jgi:hypothetical protein
MQLEMGKMGIVRQDALSITCDAKDCSVRQQVLHKAGDSLLPAGWVAVGLSLGVEYAPKELVACCDEHLVDAFREVLADSRKPALTRGIGSLDPERISAGKSFKINIGSRDW